MATTKCKNAWFSEKENVVYINTRCISPDTSKMSFRDHCRELDKAFAMSYVERIEKFATDEQKKELYDFIAQHPGSKISEYIDA